MKELKSVGGLTKATIVMLCIFMFSVACMILTYIYQLIEFSRYDAEVQLTELLPSQLISGLTAIAYALVYVITAIFFLKWVYRVSRNLHEKTANRWDHSAGGSVGWYFVPIATLFKPYQAMREIWSKAHKQKWGGKTKLLPGWWTLWLVTTIGSHIVGRLPTTTVGECRFDAVICIVMYLLFIALTLTAIALISNITQAYEKNYEQISDNEEADKPEPDCQENLQTLDESAS